MDNTLNKEEKKIYDFMLEHDIALNTILDVIIKSNNLIGVGLITLKDGINDHIDTKL